MDDWELWGTCSVRDHLARNSFVAEVLLFDRLVVPVPPAGDEKEEKRWRKDWDPELQARLLAIVGTQRLVAIPWSDFHRERWKQQFTKRKTEAEAERAEGSSPAGLAAAARRDLAFDTTREVLGAYIDTQRKRSLKGLVPNHIDVIPVYASLPALRRDLHVGTQDVAKHAATLRVFGWRFFVPHASGKSREDLLKMAVELAEDPATQKHRRAFHRWRRNHVLTGTPSQELREEMEGIVSDYHQAMRKYRMKKVARHAFAVTTLVAAIGGAIVAVPAAAAALGVAVKVAPVASVSLGAFAGFSSYLASDWNKPEIAERLRAGALLHSARRKFGW